MISCTSLFDNDQLVRSVDHTSRAHLRLIDISNSSAIRKRKKSKA